MRDYGKVFTPFWTSKTIAGLSDDGKVLALYLLTCEHGTMIGAFRLPIAYACDDLGWPAERFRKAFQTLEDCGFAIFCRESKWVCIVKYLKWNPPGNPNQKTGVQNALNALPDTCFTEGLRKGWETLCHPVTGAVVVTGTGAGAGGDPAASAKGKKRSAEQGIADWTESLDGADAIASDDPVFAYADKINLPRDYLALAWSEFEARHLESGKRYKDWRAAFRKCVRENWYRLWFDKDGQYALTTAGLQAQRAAA